MQEVGSTAGLPPERIFDLQVAVSEACANAIEHAASEVEVEAWVLNDRVVIEVRNDGVFQPGLYKDDHSRRRGLGLPLMVSLSDQIHVARLPGDRTCVSLTFLRTVEREVLETALGPFPSPEAAVRQLEAEVKKLRVMTTRAEEFARERTEVSEERRRRLEELETLMDIMPVAIWVAQDPEGRDIVGNVTANALFDAETGENVFAPGADTPKGGPARVGTRRYFREGKELSPEELPMQLAAARGVGVRGWELQVLKPNGDWMTTLGNAGPLRDVDGRVRGSVGVFMDISERKKALETLAGQRASLEFLSATAAHLLTDLSPDEIYDYIAEQVAALTGNSLVAVTSYDLARDSSTVRSAAGPREDWARAAEILAQEPQGMIVPRSEESRRRLAAGGIQRLDGGSIEVLSAVPFSRETCHLLEQELDAGGMYIVPVALGADILGSVVIGTKGDRELKNGATVEAFVNQAALALKRAQAEETCRRSEERYRATFEQHAVGIAYVGLDRKYLEVNARLAAVLGYEREELVGMSIEEVTHPDDVGGRLGLIDALIAGGTDSTALELRLKRKGGKYIWARISASAVLDPEGRVLHLASVIEDITERVLAESRVERDRALFGGIARIFEEAMSHRSQQALGDVCLEVAQDITDSSMGFIGEFGSDGHLQQIAVSNPSWEAAGNQDGHGRTGSGPTPAFQVGGLFGRVLSEGKSLVSNQGLIHPESTSLPAGHPTLNSFLAVPLIQHGKILGMFAVGNNPNGYDSAHQEMLEALAPAIVEAFERKRSEEALRHGRERYRKLAARHEQLYAEQLRITESLQFALLHIPSQIGRVRLGHLYRSATEAAFVGGDFYDAFPVGDGLVAFLIGDVSGHGIEAARMALLVKDVVHAFTHQSLDPREVLAETNALLIEKAFPGFVSLFLGILDTTSGSVHYGSAGHPYCLVKRASGEVEEFASGSIPLGVRNDVYWQAGEQSMAEGDIFLLYTDGLIEVRNEGRFFGEDGLVALLQKATASVEDLPSLILDEVAAFAGGVFRDDVAMLALTISPELSAEPEAPAGD